MMTAGPFDYFADDDDPFTQLLDFDVDRVDLVGAPANGVRFIVTKSADRSLMPPDFIRGLIAKAKDSPQQPIFDQRGRLIGMADPKDVRPVAGPSSGADADPAQVEADRLAQDAETAKELTPVPSDVPGTATEDVVKAVAKAGGLRNASERAVAARAVAKITHAEKTMTPAGVESVKLHAVGDATREIARLRAQAQSGVVRKAEPAPAVMNLRDYWAKNGTGKLGAASRRRQGKG